jgi:hypothetical protein
MIIEDEDETQKALANDKMRKIYNSIKSNDNLKKHIIMDRSERIKFIQNYPYDNLPHSNTFLFNNICMFSDLSCVNGYFKGNDNIKMIDFNGNFKVNEKINISQRCVLPQAIFQQKYDYKNDIPPLKKEELEQYLLK